MQLPSPKRNDPPLYSNVELDDVVIHFRCGDLISSNSAAFAFSSLMFLANIFLPMHDPLELQHNHFVCWPKPRDGQCRL